MGRLTEAIIESLEPGKSMGDGRGSDGLRIVISKTGVRTFVQKYRRPDGKYTTRTLGTYPDELGLQDARIDAWSNARRKAQGLPARDKTVREVAEEYYRSRETEWSKSTCTQWRRSLDKSIYPVIGDTPVAAVTRAHINQILRPEWPRPKAQHNRFRLRMIFDDAYNDELRPDNPVDSWKPTRSRKHKTRHHDAVPLPDAALVLEIVRTSNGPNSLPAPRLCAEFAALTACRGHEARQASWREVNRARTIWTIPAAHRKAGDKPLRVPLSDRAREVLREAADAYGPRGLLFPSKAGKAMGGATTAQVMERAVAEADTEGTLHGWRSVFKDWCDFSGVHHRVSERALGHKRKSKTAKAYGRGDLLPQRAPVMQRWARFLMDDDDGEVLKVMDEWGIA